jgi:hypothetical protein
MADQPEKPPEKPGMPWLLIGGVLAAAWWWEKKFRGKSVGEAAMSLLSDDEADDSEDEDEDESPVDDVDWTDAPVGKGRKGKQLSDIAGPITDLYVQPIKLAAKGYCDDAVSTLERAARQGDQIAERKKPVVRRALRRAALIVTEKCPKEVAEAAAPTEWEEGVAAEVEKLDVRLPTSGRSHVFTRDEIKLPGPKGARSFSPTRGTKVVRTRGEGGRFRRKIRTSYKRRESYVPASETTLEYRRKGANEWRVLDLHTGAETRKKVPTGKPRGRPKKLV